MKHNSSLLKKGLLVFIFYIAIFIFFLSLLSNCKQSGKQTEKQNTENAQKGTINIEAEKDNITTVKKEEIKNETDRQNTEKTIPENEKQKAKEEIVNNTETKNENQSVKSNKQTLDNWVVPAKYKSMKNPVKADSESLSVGKTLWAKFCKFCHGKTGIGNIAKFGDFTGDKFQSQSDGDIFYKTTFGKDKMPAYSKKIPDEKDIWHLVNFMRTFK